ncbi:helix-turn-helix domain-containing protein [Paenibacillus sp. MZ04-78.2]|uniref:helix-turn-helix domain-containing protein n=1 Tax=Paenibacillus sp. MZ04-78.2 TaxID=2962034 RepID=UPI0020B8CF58|nr:helix-turn-helix domain-containing protein [Paenibacillus sp. MZ04-78.2]MCP3775923.1 helix-turn-helix domain-containing protein [Paenibacillus sp. MZ04-78.2]
MFDLVNRAQQGDNEALYEVIAVFLPAIRSARQKIKRDRRDDLEQILVETMINKILSYDLSQTPDFSAFCRQLHEVENQS